MKTRPADATIGARLVQVQTLQVDVMIVEGVPSLIGFTLPLDLILCKSLHDFDSNKPSRAASTIKDGIDGLVLTLASRDLTTRRVISDGEVAIGKLISHLNSLALEVTYLRSSDA